MYKSVKSMCSAATHINPMTQTDWAKCILERQWARELWLYGEDNLWLSRFTGRISVWSAPLTFFLKLWFPFEASVRRPSSMGDVIQTYLRADSFKSQTVKETCISRFSHSTRYKANTRSVIIWITAKMFWALPAPASLSLLLWNITELKVAVRKAISAPLCWIFVHDCRASMVACSMSSLSIWTMPRGRPKATIAALFKLRQIPKTLFF